MAGLIAWLATGGVPYAASQGTAQGDGDPSPAALEYATWAERVSASPPDGVQLLPALEDRLAEKVRVLRREHDLGPLRPDPGLERAARAHAIDMLERGYIGHVGPAGRSVGERVGILHRRFIGSTGENLAEYVGIPASTVAEQVGPMALTLMRGFLGSAGHRKNLLDPAYTDHGIGAAAANERLLVVHVFGARSAQLAQELSLQVRAGSKLPLAFEDGEGQSAPAQYGFARPGQHSREIVPLDVALAEVDVEPGTWQLQFFLPTDQADRFLVVPGPIVAVQ